MLDEAQAGIKIAGRNISNLRYAESEDELKSLLMKVKEESEKAGWKQWLTFFGGSKISADGDCSHESKRCLLLRRKVMANLDSIVKSRDILCQQRSI